MLEIRDLNVYYDGLQALYSVSLNILDEELVCILGPNGAGKSTLLQTAAGVLPAQGGEILLEGRPIHGLPAHELAARGLALIPEEGWLFPQMSVEENVLMGAFPKTARKDVKRQLAFVYHLFPRLAERRKQPTETLSGGERQMVAVGRGLMSNPRIILLDEPSLGLAPLVVKDILQILVKINREEKTTILLTEQNIFHALKITRRGYVMENGAIVMEGASKELLGNEHIRKNYLGI
ncbi:MAG: ABC transporter ATP-binding protein [Desulfobacterales bacterium]|nr:ABC transporter ATP-binding protein [Desulfobacterales bacterium]